ncbi:bifunctional 3'-5' exonuclease/DNA polymerase [Leucobacter sp. CSA1]|uniref:DNA-directed DNA polymerase n=1 Tax=Leucobacter chromiisoli TaxID=2796471 RepID=A0A934Q796_9MICO|nr:bifunctional 3'-5' exonuclease/DNA polymerase [Leucobacter chromiisoli]MBK0419595.1 bifunctional 3'-5' exonuclease/DNA polymerase [Leucobacter chromiisoli]
MPSRSGPSDAPRWCVLGRVPGGGVARGRVAAVEVDAAGERSAPIPIATAELPAFVAARERSAPRWVWSDTPSWYPRLLEAGVRIERCHDLRLCHAILSRSEAVPDRGPLLAAARWEAGPGAGEGEPAESALFEIETPEDAPGAVPHDLDAALEEFDRQRAALAACVDPGRLGLLVAAESAGALVAAEMAAAGVPWDAAEHDRLLSAALGPRPARGAKPVRLLELAEEVRAALGDPRASLDSPPKLLRALRSAGIDVESTSRWELAEHEHPAIRPLLRYKKLSRLLTAKGWAWIDEWVRDGRYHPVYVPGGVVTGRWASSGGGALQLPRQLRPALRADPGWVLVSADVAQLEPRVLAAMAADGAMAAAGSGRDLYSGLVEQGIVGTRQEAKIAVLGAMYGSTTGDSGRLVPRLRRSFPAAMRLVDTAAAAGEQGGVVSTWLGRSSPRPGDEWEELQARASLPGATSRDESRARRAAREFGRFTRNFVVQGTAAEWALAWLAELRLRLARLPSPTSAESIAPARASGPAFERQPHLVFFLHDEVMVHAPEGQAAAVAAAVRESAEAAGRLLFGSAPVDFPLELRIGERALKE